MTSLGLLLPLALILALLALLTGALIIWDKTRLWKEKANTRLTPLHLYWDFYRLYDIPQSELDRNAFFLARGHQAGSMRMISIDGSAVVILGLVLLVQWSIYPARKRSALKKLAGDQSLSDEEIRMLAERLR
jgi:hypothetical protein